MTQPVPPHTWEFPNPDGSTSLLSYGWNPPPPVPPMLVGSDHKPVDLVRYPKLAYVRLFGAVGKGIPSVTSLPAGVTPHVSFKDQPTAALLDPWLASLDRDVYLTWHHEPEGDMTPDAYKAGWNALGAIVYGQQNPHRVTLVEVFTLYAQTHGKTPWSQLWTDNATMFGLDSYNTVVAKTGYPDPAAFFKVATDAVAGMPHVGLLIPELGTRLALDDAAGYGAAAWYTACADYLRGQGCRAVAAWDQMGANSVDWTLTGKPLAAWQAVVAGQ